MKKILLSSSALCFALTSFSQIEPTSDGFLLDNTKASSNCYLNSVPSNGGIMAHGTTIVKGPNYILAAGSITLTAESVIPAQGDATWFGLPNISGTGEAAVCGSLYDAGTGVNMTSNSNVQIKAKAAAIGDTLEFFLGGEGQWFPASSTFNTGAGKTIPATCVFTKAGEFETFNLDFSSIDAPTWTAWAGKNKVQSIGFRVAKGTSFEVEKVAIGTSIVSVGKVEAVSNFSIVPNPASSLVAISFNAKENSTLELSDLTGKVVLTSNVNQGVNNLNLNVSSYQSGVYFVSVKSAQGISVEKLIIK